MKYAIFETIRSKSDLGGYQLFQKDAIALLEQVGRNLEYQTSTFLCCLTSETDVLGKLIARASSLEVAYRVLYFSEEPTLFESKPKT